MLEVLGLGAHADALATELPYGQQRRLEIARALAGRPRLLLLDEPAAGLNPQESEDLMRLIQDIRQRFGLTILLIEHDMKVVMGICERIAVLDYGVKIAEGTPEEIRCDPQGHRGLPGRGDAARMSQLEVQGLDVYYGAVHALKGVSLHVEAGEIVTLIGANGAGKTTLLRTISGLVPAKAGRVIVRGQRHHALPAHEIVALGVSQAPEGRMVFANLSVEDNLELGAYRRKDRAGDPRRTATPCTQLFPRLLERRKQLAGTLSGGEQQMLAIARALMCRPRLLLLDEPSLGIAPHPGARHLPQHRRDQPPRRHGAAGRAERAHGAGRRAARLRARDRPRRARGRSREAGREPRGAGRLPGWLSAATVC